MQRKKIAFVCDFWNHAGTEKAAINWLNLLAKEYDVTLFLLADKINVVESLASNIKIKKNIVYNNYYCRILFLKHWKLIDVWGIKTIRKLIWNQIFKDGEYSCIINFSDSSATFFKYLKFKDTKLLAWNHFNYGEEVSFTHGNLQSLKEKYYNGYLNSTYVISVSNAAQASFNNFFKEYNTKFNVKTIYTPQDVKIIKEQASEEVEFTFKPGFNILNLARIDELQKQQLRLLEVIAKLNTKFAHVNFYFIGDANPVELQKFTTLKEKLNLKNVYYLGKKVNPYPYVKKCDLFILPSKFEGYGLVLEEALILNKPVLTTNMTSKEILCNEKYGMVCENNKQGIYDALSLIISKPMVYKELQTKANLYEQNNQKILEKFNELIYKEN